MTFTDGYTAEHIDCKSKSRLNVTKGTGIHEPFERLVTNKKGEAFIYLVKDTHSKGKSKADYAITHGSMHISGIYTMPGERYAYGDIATTDDAIIIDMKNLKETSNGIIDGSMMTIFIARGLRRDARQLCVMANEGVFDAEFETIKSKMKNV